MFFFQNFCHSYFLWENLVAQNQKFAKLNEIWSRGTLYMLISTLTFFFSKFFSFIFFCQIWSQNVKFFKLTEIWYIGRLLYAYFDFIVYFSILLSFIFILANLVPKAKVFQIHWNVVFWYLFFQNFKSFIFLG